MSDAKVAVDIASDETALRQRLWVISAADGLAALATFLLLSAQPMPVASR